MVADESATQIEALFASMLSVATANLLIAKGLVTAEEYQRLIGIQIADLDAIAVSSPMPASPLRQLLRQRLEAFRASLEPRPPAG